MNDHEKLDALANPDIDPSVQANTTAVRIQKALRNLIIVTVLLGLAIVGTVGYIYSVADANNKALCAFRGDVQDRVDQTAQYLHDHPHGTKLISTADLQRSLDNSKRTVQSLSNLDCADASVKVQ